MKLEEKLDRLLLSDDEDSLLDDEETELEEEEFTPNNSISPILIGHHLESTMLHHSYLYISP
jgi:hypothetical protein